MEAVMEEKVKQKRLHKMHMENRNKLEMQEHTPEYNPTGHLENTGKAIAGLFSLLSGGNDTPSDNSQVPPPKKKKKKKQKRI